ncbi:MAG: polyprenyl synthetase family protein [Verrucomicrobia bacterium]|nr:polyprenyl synthetase family protein [Verrucomicrobiota bacterium]
MATGTEKVSAAGSARAQRREPEAHDLSTAHLKLIPPAKELRLKIRLEAVRVAANLDRSRPLTKEVLRGRAEQLMQTVGLPPGYLGFTMVAISNEFWREQFMAVDFKRRLLLLPHCLKHTETCPADYDAAGLNCTGCGGCVIADFKLTADELGYKVLVAEGTPAMLKVLTSGEVDAVLGIACLNALERAFDKVLKVGVPSLAVPLLSNDCAATTVDVDWVSEAVKLRAIATPKRTRTYLPLLRAANDMFAESQLHALAPRSRVTPPGDADPIGATESLGYEWLASGGKRFRPFITLAAYDAMNGGKNVRPADMSVPVELPAAVRRVAMAMEVFHKASLLHDDIEDDDTYRYGRETLHRRHGVPTAINIGDYLIGLGYRLVSREAKTLGAEAVNDILERLSQAHEKLAEGQGAELFWRNGGNMEIKPLDALKIYALKTAPAFEAALYAGMRLAGPLDAREPLVAEFSRNLGVAYQIINDLEDWDGDDNNKLVRGQDVLSARPTLLLALAMEKATAAQKHEMREILGDAEKCECAIHRVRQIYAAHHVFEQAETMVRKYRERCEAVAESATPDALRELLSFFVNTLLERDLPPLPPGQ